jgi:hypothetical protein
MKRSAWHVGVLLVGVLAAKEYIIITQLRAINFSIPGVLDRRPGVLRFGVLFGVLLVFCDRFKDFMGVLDWQRLELVDEELRMMESVIDILHTSVIFRCHRIFGA